MEIQPFNTKHLDAVVGLSLRAWAPVFESIQGVMDSEVYREFYPDGWRARQQTAVEEVCAAENMHVWVAVEGGQTVGFVAVKLHQESKMGEIYMIAVDPDSQRRGIGAALTNFAVEWMKGAGMTIAMIETGADDGHGPARSTYEKAGFGLWPVARYFKKL